MNYDENGNLLPELSFLELIEELLYDWTMSLQPEVFSSLNRENGDYSINKTFITKDSSDIPFLHYKTTSLRISNDAYSKLDLFFENIYKNDYFLEIFMSLLSDNLVNLKNTTIDEENKLINFDHKLKIEKYKEAFIMHSKDFFIEINDQTYEKIKNFTNLLQTDSGNEKK